jgi:uncharacterized protein with von Willebrand factor type A (vWA) domain
MQQVIDTLNELGASSVLTQATVQYFKNSIDINLGSFFPEAPARAEEVIAVLAAPAEVKNL